MTIRAAAKKHGAIGARIIVASVGKEGGPLIDHVIEERILEAHNELQAVAPRIGEILFKAWVKDEAERCGVKLTAIYNRVARGKYPKLKMRRVNPRLIYVKP